MIEQPGAILNKMTNGTYAINYSNMTIPTSITSSMGLDLDNTSLQLLNLSNATSNSLNSNLTFKLKDRQALNNGTSGFINWHQMLVDQCDNLVHILSLRGVMLYASKSCETLLGYSSSKLQNRPLSEICHPADINPVLREIKSCSENQDLFSLIYRLKHIDGSFIWFETFGKIHTDSSTSRKCIILSAKPIKMPQLPSIWTHILGGLSDSDFWWRMTSEGLVLATTSGMESNLGSQYKDCIGTSLYQLIHPDSCLPLTACLEACKTGRISGLRYFTVGLGCKIAEIESIFYPSGASSTHILARCRLIKEETDRRLPAPNVSYPLSDGLAINFNPPYLFGELLPNHDRTMKYEVHRLKSDNARLRDELKRYEANESNLPPSKIQRSNPTQSLQCPQCRQYSVTRSLALDGSKIDICSCGWQCIS
jgi:PAS domain S-box-containing protein